MLVDIETIQKESLAKCKLAAEYVDGVIEKKEFNKAKRRRSIIGWTRNESERRQHLKRRNQVARTSQRSTQDLLKEAERVVEMEKGQKAQEEKKSTEDTVAEVVDSFPYDFDIVELNRCFVDTSYQRPITTLYKKIRENFNPALFGTLVLSLRTTEKYAIIDGQTRWKGLRDRGGKRAPALVFTGLSRQDEATLFELLQTQRKSMMSWWRFRASLVAKNPEAMAIKRMVEEHSGWEVGDSSDGKIGAVGALESCYRRDPATLEDTLAILWEAWKNKDYVPSGDIIRGLHFFLLKNPTAEDKKLITRFSILTPADLKRAALTFREASGTTGPANKYMAQAIEARYRRK